MTTAQEKNRPEEDVCKWAVQKSEIGSNLVYVAHNGMEVGSVTSGHPLVEGCECILCGKKIKVIED